MVTMRMEPLAISSLMACRASEPLIFNRSDMMDVVISLNFGTSLFSLAMVSSS